MSRTGYPPLLNISERSQPSAHLGQLPQHRTANGEVVLFAVRLPVNDNDADLAVTSLAVRCHHV